MVDEALEAAVRRRWEAGDLSGAATEALEGYGPEVLGFLIATAGDGDRGAEAFAELGEALWRGLPSFAWRSSLRTWLYTLARNVAIQQRRRESVRRRHAAGLSEAGEVAERVRSRTLPHLRTEAKIGVMRLRDALAPEDRELLVLRIDRAMAWSEVAAIVAPDEERAKAAARLRKRFQLVKDDLRERARALGLLGEDEP